MKTISTKPKIPKAPKPNTPRKPNFGTPRFLRLKGLKNPLRFTK